MISWPRLFALLPVAALGLFGGAWVAQSLLALMGEPVAYLPMFALNALYSAPLLLRLLQKARRTHILPE